MSDAHSYEVQINLTDKFGTTSAVTSISTGYCLYHIPASGKGITFGGIAEGDGFNVKMNATFGENVNMKKNLQVDGDVTGKYLTATWLRTIATTDLGKAPPKVAVLDNSGWIYYRTPVDLIYPVGSIYMSVNATNPKELFGGTWEKIQGRFLLGMSSSYPAGSTGGEATHTLTTSEIPYHNHNIGQEGNTSKILPTQIAVGDSSQSEYVTTLQGGASGWYKSSVAWDGRISTRNQTSPYGQAHNNMPPYLAVYIWKRTA